MIGMMRALKPYAGHPSVAAAYHDALVAVNVARLSAGSALGADAADKSGLLDGVKKLPVFTLQPGGSW